VIRIAELPSAKASLIRDLLRERKAREAEEAFVIEGFKPIHDLATRGSASVMALVATQRWLEQGEADLRRWFAQQDVPIYRASEQTFDRLSDVQTSQGILAVVRKPQWDQAGIFARPRLFAMYGEGIQDPANVGAIIRTATAFGLDALWLSSDSADVFNPKVVRAAAGTVLTLPVFSLKEGLALFARQHCQLVAAETPGATSMPIRQVTSLPSRAILALGNESRGLSAATLQQATARFHIPVSPLVESLNVAASAAIAAFHLAGLPREDGAKREPSNVHRGKRKQR
jgi:TrmH family RNA methyltransferase